MSKSTNNAAPTAPTAPTAPNAVLEALIADQNMLITFVNTAEGRAKSPLSGKRAKHGKDAEGRPTVTVPLRDFVKCDRDWMWLLIGQKDHPAGKPEKGEEHKHAWRPTDADREGLKALGFRPSRKRHWRYYNTCQD